MIVKNEAHVIERCLTSVLPLIDAFYIHDTGSTDGTQEAIYRFFDKAEIPGHVADVPWVGFGQARTNALSDARNSTIINADYSLVIDADDVLEVANGFELPALDADAYDLDIRLGNIAYQRPQLFSNKRPWAYRGVLHEFADCADGGEVRREKLAGVVMVCGDDGARRRDLGKYAADAELLKGALVEETDSMMRARYTFYLAQSYRDAGDRASAVVCYAMRTTLGHWGEEVYVSYLNLIRLSDPAGTDPLAVVSLAVRALEVCPHRAEAACAAALHLRLRGEYDLAYRVAETVKHLGMPHEGLFVEPDVYAYQLVDELAVSAYHSKRPLVCLAGCLDILREGRVPADQRDRILDNAGHALQQMRGGT
jgi:glycosyltransferase involved in cell wall biosynthesis